MFEETELGIHSKELDLPRLGKVGEFTPLEGESFVVGCLYPLDLSSLGIDGLGTLLQFNLEAFDGLGRVETLGGALLELSLEG